MAHNRNEFGMLSPKRAWKAVRLLMAMVTLVGCAASVTEAPPEDAAKLEAGAHSMSEVPPPLREAIPYYIARLPDRDYVETYGGEEHPRPWYSAAEALGEIGKPAVPALVERLDTPDPYELMLALYALMLASQDPALMAETGGDYLRLGSVLTQDTNGENRRRALAWWQRYRHLWP